MAIAWRSIMASSPASLRPLLLEPAVRTARALDRLSAERRARLQARMERWVEAGSTGTFRRSRRLQSRRRSDRHAGHSRALAAMLVDAGGHLPRRTVAAQLVGAEQGRPPRPAPASGPARRARRLCPIAPEARCPAMARRIACGAFRPADAAPAGAVCGNPRRQRRPARRVACLPPVRHDGCASTSPTASRAMPTRSGSTAAAIRSTRRLATSIGLDEATVRHLMAEVGCARGRSLGLAGPPPPSARTAGTRPGNAFAALAGLKR